MKRKSRSKKNFRGRDDMAEQQSLLDNESDSGPNDYQSESPNDDPTMKREKLPKHQRTFRRLDSKVNMFAPEARDTTFEDVPAMTVCPSCRAKVVTKTSHSKKKPWCLCCCSNEVLSFFKPVRHKCPKCDYKIAKFSRFAFPFNFTGSQTVYDKPIEKVKSIEKANVSEDIMAMENGISNLEANGGNNNNNDDNNNNAKIGDAKKSEKRSNVKRTNSLLKEEKIKANQKMEKTSKPKKKTTTRK